MAPLGASEKNHVFCYSPESFFFIFIPIWTSKSFSILQIDVYTLKKFPPAAGK